MLLRNGLGRGPPVGRAPPVGCGPSVGRAPLLAPGPPAAPEPRATPEPPAAPPAASGPSAGRSLPGRGASGSWRAGTGQMAPCATGLTGHRPLAFESAVGRSSRAQPCAGSCPIGCSPIACFSPVVWFSPVAGAAGASGGSGSAWGPEPPGRSGPAQGEGSARSDGSACGRGSARGGGSSQSSRSSPRGVWPTAGNGLVDGGSSAAGACPVAVALRRSESCRRRAAISTSRSVTACAIRLNASSVAWTL